MDQTITGANITVRRAGCSVRVLLAFVALAALGLALLTSAIRDELLLRVPISGRGFVSIYAESEVMYEPPGYIYCEISRAGKIVVPRRRFMGIGIERTPVQRFRVYEFPKDDLVAVTLGGDIVFLCDLQASRVWPDPYTVTDAENYAFAKKALRRIGGEHPGLRCSGIDEYVRGGLWKRRGDPDPALVPDAP